MTETNSQLDAILALATTLYEHEEWDDPGSKEPADAVRYAVLKHLEDDENRNLLVKYGSPASAVREEWGLDDDVWRLVPDGDCTLFYVEDEGLTMFGQFYLDLTMLAIGAWYLGETGIAGDPRSVHRLYVWPNDHPILDAVAEVADGG